MHNYFWFDLETTGLDEHAGVLLEWGLALANDEKDGDMQVTDEWSGVVHHTVHALADLTIDPFVMRMHTDNGLWKEVDESTITLAESDEFLAGLCCEVAGRDDVRGIILAGNSVHFDLRWVRVHLPKFAKHLSHRVFDVSTLKGAETSWGEPLEYPEANAHRALPDVRASIAAAAAYRRRRYGK